MRPILCVTLLASLLASRAAAEVPVERSFTRLPSSNGHTAILAELPAAKLTHFREHLFATEEPLLDGSGNEVWVGNQPQVIHTRDLLYDAYFGLRSGGTQRWLAGVPVDLDASGYAAYAAGRTAGTGVVQWSQKVGALELTTFAFAPRGLPHAAFVLALRVRNTGGAPERVEAFSLHNFHLGFGRPGVLHDIGALLTGSPALAYGGAFVVGAVGLMVSLWALRLVHADEFKRESQPTDTATMFAGAME
ncbi:MAG: hypothetical protein ACK4N5_20205 [Myxococcales bacterium]